MENAERKKVASPLGTFRQYYASLAANMGVFGMGCVMGWTSPALDSLQKDFNVSPLDKSWITSIAHLGGLASAITAGTIMDKLGRRNGSLLMCIPMLGGWILQSFPSDVFMLYIARFIVGFSCAFYGAMSPVFVGEISSSNIRGILSNIYALAITGGMLFSYGVGAFVNWRLLSIACAITPIIIFTMVYYMEESPRYLLHVGRREDALNSLAWYRGKDPEHEDVLDEFETMTRETELAESVGGSRKYCFGDLWRRESMHPLLLSILLLVFEEYSGWVAVVAFASEIFRATGHEAGNELSIILGVAQCGAALLSCVLIDRLGRKPLLIIGQVFTSLSLGYLTFFFHYKEDFVLLAGWVPAMALVVYVVFLNIGINPISTTMMGEILPQRIRGIGSGICTAFLRGSQFIIAFSFQPLVEFAGPTAVFGFFTFISIAGIIFVHYFVPETKGKNFEEISQLFKKKVG